MNRATRGPSRPSFRLWAGLGLFFYVGAYSAPPTRAEGPAIALSFWPLLPLVASARPAAQAAHMALAKADVAASPASSWSRPSPSLPRVQLQPDAVGEAFSLQLGPIPARAALPDRMPKPHGFRWELETRTVYMRPEFRVTQDRRGAYFCMRGIF